MSRCPGAEGASSARWVTVKARAFVRLMVLVTPIQLAPVQMQYDPPQGHLDPATVASYLEHRLSGERLQQAEAHLASCSSCRTEVVQLSAVVRARLRPRLLHAGSLAAAAAAILFFVASPRIIQTPSPDAHRGSPAVATTVELLAPKGANSPSGEWRWQPIHGADKYELTVFDADGRVAWDTSTTQTTVRVIPARRIETGRQYFWRVRARVGWDRWVSSEFVEFSLRATP